LIEFIKDCAPSVIGVQECTNNVAAEITEGSGTKLDLLGIGHCQNHMGLHQVGSP